MKHIKKFNEHIYNKDYEINESSKKEKIIENVPEVIWDDSNNYWVIPMPAGVNFYARIESTEMNNYISITDFNPNEPTSDDNIYITLNGDKKHEKNTKILQTWSEMNYLSMYGLGNEHLNKYLVKTPEDDYGSKTW